MLSGTGHLVNPAVDTHALAMELRNTFKMDQGRHLSDDPLVHFVRRQVRKAIATHGHDMNIVLKGTYPSESEQSPKLLLSYRCEEVNGQLEIYGPSCQVFGFRPETDVIQLVIHYDLPATGGIQPIVDDLNTLRYR